MMERDEMLRHQAHALMAQGMTREDSAVAIQLARFILDIDAAAFPDRSADVICHALTHPNGYVAGFDNDMTHDLNYVVYAKGVHQQFREDCIKTRFIRGYGPGRLCPTLREHLIVAALHEVRHRVQTWLGDDLRMWAPGDHDEGLMDAVLRTVRRERLYLIAEARAMSRRRLQTQLKEFDALVVEYYARHLAHQVREASELAELVWLEP